MSGQPLFHLDILSGLGGFSLAARDCGLLTVGHIESDPFAALVLERHFGPITYSTLCGLELTVASPSMDDPHLTIPGLESEQKGLPFDCFAQKRLPFPDVVTVQLPCSFEAGARSFSVKNFLDVINDLSPTYLVATADPRILEGEFSYVLDRLHEYGFDCEWAIISPEAVLLPINSPRLWLIAAKRYSYLNKKGGILDGCARHERILDAVAAKLKRRSISEFALPLPFEQGYRDIPGGHRGKKGPFVQQRLLALAQAIVPQIAAEIFEFIVQAQDVAIDGYEGSSFYGENRQRRPVHHECFCFAIDLDVKQYFPSSGAMFSGMVFQYPESEILNPPAADGLWYPPSVEDAFFDKKAQANIPSLSDQYGGQLNPEFVEALLGYPPNYTLPGQVYEPVGAIVADRRKKRVTRSRSEQMSLEGLVA